MINQDKFRFALGKYITGVTIVTCNGKNGPIGITANSFANDAIIGSEMFGDYDTVRKGLDWFKQHFAKQYMVVLD